MKKTLLTTCAIVAMAVTATAQVPQKINYQGVVRNDKGEAIANKVIHVKISIGSPNDAGQHYTETHQVRTNDAGLYTLSIGAGQPISGSFDNIAWKDGKQFLTIAIDDVGNGD